MHTPRPKKASMNTDPEHFPSRDTTGREREFSTLFEQAPQPYIALDGRGIIRRSNRLFRELFNLDRNTAEGRKFQDFVGGPDRSVFFKHYDEILRSGEMRNLEILCRTEDETLFPCLLTCRVIRREKDDPLVLCLVNHVVERAGLPSFSQSIMDTLPISIFVKDEHRRIILANKTFADYFHRAPSDMIGLTAEDYLHDRVFAEAMAEDEMRVLAAPDQPPAEREHQVALPGGEVRWIHSFKTVMTDRAGSRYILGIGRDITEYRTSKTVERLTEQMQTLRNLAEGIAHEINNPLGAILQSTQNIRRRLDPDFAGNLKHAEELGCSIDTVREYLERRQIFRFIDGISEAGLRAARTVSNLVDITHRRTGGPAPQDINRLVMRTAERLNDFSESPDSLDFSRILIRLSLAPHLPKVTGIAEDIEMAFSNLIHNAALAAGTPGISSPEIVVSTRSQGDSVIISFKDNGPGIPDNVMAQVFDPFFTTRTPGLNAGLGLPLARGIIMRDHGGDLSIESSEEGTHVVVTLPAADS